MAQPADVRLSGRIPRTDVHASHPTALCRRSSSSAELGALGPEMSATSIASFEEQWQDQDLLFTKIAPMAGKPFDTL
ncbi:hypothetical protein BS628_23405 [Agrobacterium radiobacter]|nr:hypothetical protein BS628_23405 [Agrobacterium radiobacter]